MYTHACTGLGQFLVCTYVCMCLLVGTHVVAGSPSLVDVCVYVGKCTHTWIGWCGDTRVSPCVDCDASRSLGGVYTHVPGLLEGGHAYPTLEQRDWKGDGSSQGVYLAALWGRDSVLHPQWGLSPVWNSKWGTRRCVCAHVKGLRSPTWLTPPPPQSTPRVPHPTPPPASGPCEATPLPFRLSAPKRARASGPSAR